MSKNNIVRLLENYQRGECTEQERALVDRWFEAHGAAETSFEKMSAERQEAFTEDLLADILKRNRPKSIYRRLYPYAAAACVLLAVGFFYFKKSKITNDVAPGTALAILKTGGRTIILDKTNKGIIASQNHTTITKTASGELAYAGENNSMVYDTLQIPAGGRPQALTLADGSKILLNAATTLRFPESKRGMLELISGEIYATIVHDPKAPLQIKAPGQLITDIGTEFDLSAYPDEPDSRTTLIEGAIKVNTIILKPGQQSILMAGNMVVAAANMEQTTAWKNGYFRFNGEHIDVIMRQLSRWYGIEVVYSGKVTEEVFYGKITRQKNISEVLHMLEKTQKVQFKIEGRRVTVSGKN